MAKSWYLVSFGILAALLIVASGVAAGLSQGVARGVYVAILVASVLVLGVTIWRLIRAKGRGR
jgi:Na+/pantothenate symporter